jgi:hypothetical protein
VFEEEFLGLKKILAIVYMIKTDAYAIVPLLFFRLQALPIYDLLLSLLLSCSELRGVYM